jgi:autophagy-related protein 5
MQCPRYTYLPIILPELRDNFVNSVLAPDELESLASPIEDWWFEVDTSHDGEDAHGNGEMCKWSVFTGCSAMVMLMSRLTLSLA